MSEESAARWKFTGTSRANEEFTGCSALIGSTLCPSYLWTDSILLCSPFGPSFKEIILRLLSEAIGYPTTYELLPLACVQLHVTVTPID